MTAAGVQAVIAAALADPDRLNRWRDDPGTLAALGVDSRQFDWERMRQFAGVSVKVRHNSLRGDMRLTFRGLAFGGLELSFFADYASAFLAAQRRGPLSHPEKRHAFVNQLSIWLDPTQPLHTVLLEVARHELRVAELTSLAADERVSCGMAVSGAAPDLRSHTMLAACAVHPIVACHALEASTSTISPPPRRPCHIACWRGVDGVEIAELDPLSRWLVGNVDGRRTVSDLVALLRAQMGPLPDSLIPRCVTKLVDAGMCVLLDRSRAS